MAEEHEKCPDCGTPLMDLERRLEVTDADASHRHHAVDCVVALKERVKALESRLDANRLLRRVVALWDYVSARSHEDAAAFQRELDAADGQLIEDVRRHLASVRAPTVMHTCDPQSVRQKALDDAAKLVATTNYYEPNETTARRIREYDGDEGTRGRR